MAQKSREEGEIGSESREKGDLPPCSPLPCYGPAHTNLCSYETTLFDAFSTKNADENGGFRTPFQKTGACRTYRFENASFVVWTG